ncbi:hypothetical protein VAWG006_17040 [Aeromonas enteropelogenes]|nr:hypothetical protein VAWG006_17040 [Aeromonas enteropelogenes]BEE21615.1 hypothetical protein VAWG007_17100 [Aeromonas enteropelogenes]
MQSKVGQGHGIFLVWIANRNGDYGIGRLCLGQVAAPGGAEACGRYHIFGTGLESMRGGITTGAKKAREIRQITY